MKRNYKPEGSFRTIINYRFLNISQKIMERLYIIVQKTKINLVIWEKPLLANKNNIIIIFTH